MSTSLPPEVTPLVPPYDVFAHYGRNLIERSLPQESSTRFAQVFQASRDWTTRAQRDSSDLRPVGIIGAGVGGLYAAMLLYDLGIPFHILEARDRTGGRLFTHRFDKDVATPDRQSPCGASDTPETDDEAEEQSHDYFDVGAMRFPKIPLMTRLFNLFDRPELNTPDIDLKSHLIPFIFSSDDAFSMFNGKRFKIRDIPPPPADPFIFEKAGNPQRGNVSPYFIAQGYQRLISDVIQPFADRLEADLKPPGGTAGWEYLMSFDAHSARSYMALNRNYELPAISWIETMNTSSGRYDLGLAETVLGSMSFGSTSPTKVEWKCLDGGSEVLSQSMEKYLASIAPEALEKNKFVGTIRAIGPEGQATSIGVQVVGEAEEREYPFVISTVPLPCLRTMNLDDARLSWEQSNALRQLRYNESTKVGIKFKSAWWTTMKTQTGETLNIRGGQSFTDRSVRTVVYPSYGLPGTPQPTTVLLATYALVDDAAGLAALINPPPGSTAVTKMRLKELILRDLSIIHDVKYEDLEAEYEDHFGWDWTRDPFAQGAFASFGPGNFSTLYPSMNLPAGDGRLHFASEALSVRHGWVVGALDSAAAAVKRIVLECYREKLEAFEKICGTNEEWLTGDRKPSTGPWKANPQEDLLLRHLYTHNPEWFD